MDIKIIYEDNDILVIDKPSGMVVFPEGQTTENTIIDALIKQYPDLKGAGEAPRYGVVHRLDKDTSGVLLIAKSNEALIFLQKQFKNREVDKKYTALATGIIKEDTGTIKTLIGRSQGDPRKQRTYSLDHADKPGLREAITEYKVIERFKEYTLLEVVIKTGKKHQIRCHLASLRHPIAGDKLYGFKDSPLPSGLNRQFLHASYLKIHLLHEEAKEFNSELPEDLSTIINSLEK